MINNNILSILENLKEWWRSSNKTNDDIDDLISGNIMINNYKFIITSGNRAYLNAINENTHFSIIDCGSPNTYKELRNILRNKLMSNLQNVPI